MLFLINVPVQHVPIFLHFLRIFTIIFLHFFLPHKQNPLMSQFIIFNFFLLTFTILMKFVLKLKFKPNIFLTKMAVFFHFLMPIQMRHKLVFVVINYKNPAKIAHFHFIFIFIIIFKLPRIFITLLQMLI